MENVRVSPGKAVSVGEVSLENKTGNSIVVRYDKARKTVLLVDLLSRRTRKMKNGKLLAAGLVLLADFFLVPVIPRHVDLPCQWSLGYVDSWDCLGVNGYALFGIGISIPPPLACIA